jgi:hypothetical protein
MLETKGKEEKRYLTGCQKKPKLCLYQEANLFKGLYSNLGYMLETPGDLLMLAQCLSVSSWDGPTI